MKQDIDFPTTPDDSQPQYRTMNGIDQILGLIEARWPGWWKDRAQESKEKVSAWERQYRTLCTRYGEGQVFEALSRCATIWDRADRPPLAIEVEDYWFKTAPETVAKHLHLPWRTPPKDRERGTDEERRKFVADWKKAASGSPTDALAQYSKAVENGFKGSMREYWNP